MNLLSPVLLIAPMRLTSATAYILKLSYRKSRISKTEHTLRVIVPGQVSPQASKVHDTGRNGVLCVLRFVDVRIAKHQQSSIPPLCPGKDIERVMWFSCKSTGIVNDGFIWRNRIGSVKNNMQVRCMPASFTSRFCYKSAHRVHGNCSSTTVDTSAQKKEVSLCPRPSKVVPEPTCGIQTIKIGH